MLLPRIAFLLGLVTAALGCGSSPEKSSQVTDPIRGADAGATLDGGGAGNAQLLGRVLDADNGKAIFRASVVVEGIGQTTTDSRGAFTLEAKSFRGEVAVSGKAYAPTAHALPAAGGSMQVFLKSVDKKLSFRGDKGVSAELENGVLLKIPAKAVIDGKGAKVLGPLTLEVAAVDGYKAAQAASLPGEGKAIRKDGKQGRVAISDGLSIRVYGTDGKDLSVARAAKVVAEVPLRTKGAAPGVFSYDPALKKWREEGQAKVDQGVAVADIEHLSWWALGTFSEVESCVRVCVEDRTRSTVPGAQVWLIGVSEPGVSAFFTDDSGCGAGDSAADADAVLVAEARRLVSSPKRVHLEDTGASVESAPEACQDLGRIRVGPALETTCILCSVEPTGMTPDEGTLDASVEPEVDAGSEGDAGPGGDNGGETNGATGSETNGATGSETNGATGSETNGATGSETNGATGSETNGATGTETNGATGTETNGATGTETNGTLPGDNVVIDFDALTAMSNSSGSLVPEASRLSVVLLETARVTFASDSPFVGVVNLGQGHAISPPNGIGGTNAEGALDYTKAIDIRFFFPGPDGGQAVTDFVRIRGDQLAGSGTAILIAFDADGKQLDSVEVKDVSGGPTLELKARGIHRVLVTESQGNIAFDHLEFLPVGPLP